MNAFNVIRLSSIKHSYIIDRNISQLFHDLILGGIVTRRTNTKSAKSRSLLPHCELKIKSVKVLSYQE